MQYEPEVSYMQYEANNQPSDSSEVSGMTPEFDRKSPRDLQKSNVVGETVEERKEQSQEAHGGRDVEGHEGCAQAGYGLVD